MRSSSSATNGNESIIISSSKNAVSVTLNRSKALNALNASMCQEMKSLLLKWKLDPNPPCVFTVKGAGGKAFCAGGDVKSVWQELHDANKPGGIGTGQIGSGARGSVHSDFFRIEYEMNYLIGTSKIPQVSLWDGIVMGGGVGISALGKFRVATEKTLFAMPETAIGLFPDVGSSFWLSNLKPSGVGLYIGLSGVRLQASDLLHTGIATHYVRSANLERLETALSQVENSANVKDVLDGFHAESISSLDSSKALLPKYSEEISSTFGHTNGIAEIFESMQRASSVKNCVWSKDTLQLMSKMSPTSLHLTHMQLQRGAGRTLRDCLEMEFRLMMRCMKAPDFSEGIRAVLVDKDQNAQWNPKDFRDVSPDAIEKYFTPLDDANELFLSSLR